MSCLSCNGKIVDLISFGSLPPSNRFLKEPGDCETHPLVVSQCEACGLVQLDNPMPSAMKASRFDWIRYDEPEGHLDALAEVLRTLGLTNVRGMSYKDDSLIARLGGETADAPAVIGRHILEHKEMPVEFLNSFKADTFIIEVPDCSRVLANNWYPFVWEEHVAYFTEETLKTFAAANGFSCEVYRYPMTFEDSLVAVLRRGGAGTVVIPEPCPFGSTFWETFDRVRDAFSHRRIAMIGAGHIGIKFCNMFNVPLRFFVDDNLNKQGLYTPGRCVPIRDSSAIKDADILLSALAPESEAKFRSRHGIETTSIFPLFA